MDERESIKFTIQRNVYGYLGILLEVRERFEEECLAEMRRQRSSCQTVASGMSVFFLTVSFSSLIWYCVFLCVSQFILLCGVSSYSCF